jgi:hypothetical protein
VRTNFEPKVIFKNEKFMKQDKNLNSRMDTRNHLKNWLKKKSKKCIGFLLILLCLLSISTQSTYAQDSKPRAVVIGLFCTDTAHWQIPIARELTNFITTELVNSRKYRIIEKSEVEQLIQERGIKSAQLTSAQISEIGKILNVQKIILGELAFSTTTSLRVIDVESGEIEASAIIENFPTWKGLSDKQKAKKVVQKLLK